MLTIERNNPHKKISFGILSLAIGFASTYALLSAIMPGGFPTTATHPPKQQPVAVKTASATRDSVQQTHADKQTAEAAPAAPTSAQSNAGVQSTYSAPAQSSTAASGSSTTPTNTVTQPQTSQPTQPVKPSTGLLDHVVAATETVVRTAIPIL